MLISMMSITISFPFWCEDSGVHLVVDTLYEVQRSIDVSENRWRSGGERGATP